MSVETTLPSKRLFYFALIVVSAIGPLALNIFMPSLPGLVADLSTTTGTAQLTLTLYLIGTALSQLVYGPLSDRFGRRPVLLAGLVIFVLSSIFCALATSIEMLIVARLLQSFGGASGMVLSRAIIRDLHDEKAAASVIGYVTMAWVLAPLVAPSIGGYLDQVATWRASFWVLTVFGCLALLLAATSLPETNGASGKSIVGNRLQAYKKLLGNRQFIALVATLSFTSGVFFSFLGGAPFIMVDVLNQTPLDYGLWFIAVSIGYMAGNFSSGRFSRQVGTTRMVVAGIFISLSGTGVIFIAAMAQLLSPALLFLPMGIVALGNGICLPNATAAALSTEPDAIGGAAGLAGFMQGISGALAAQLVGYFQAGFPLISVWFMLASGVLAALSFLPVMNTQRRSRIH